MVKNIVERIMRGLLLETPGDGGAGGGGGTGTQAAVNDGSATPGSGGTPETKPGAGGTKPAEDPRIAGFLADLQKERAARRKSDDALKTHQAELERERGRVRALSGLEVRSKEQEDEDAIKERLAKLYPGLAELTPEDLKALRESRAYLDESRNATKHTWTVHANKMLSSVTSEMQKALGGGKLTDRQQARVKSAYVEAAKTDPKFLRRHEAGDETLISEFVNEWVDDFVKPGERRALQAEVARRPRVPGGHDRSVVGADNKPIDVKNDDAVADFLAKGFKERGGQFGRR